MRHVEDLKIILSKAQQRAEARSQQEFQRAGNTDHVGACGFAWVDITQYEGKPIKGNTKIGKMLKQAGVDQNYRRVFSQWCNWYPGQSIDIKEAGAEEFVKVLNAYGFTAYAGSRLD